MAENEAQKKLQEEKQALLDRIAEIDAAVSLITKEAMQRYEVGSGDGARHEVERLRLSELMKARDTYKKELLEVETKISSSGKKKKRKAIYFRFRT